MSISLSGSTDRVESRAVPLSELRAHPRNYNRHSQGQIERIAQSLRKFGQPRSIVVWQFYILAGHGVVEAAKLLSWETIRADVLPDDYPEHLAMAYVAADNELARQSDPDEAALALLVDEVSQIDAELALAMGFNEDELGRLLRSLEQELSGDHEEPPADRAAELADEWGVEHGQLWQIGDHRLICGDAEDATTVARLFNGAVPRLMVTDPPYGVEYDPTWRAEAGINQNKHKMGAVVNDERHDWRAAYSLFPGDVAYVWHAGRFAAEVKTSLEASGFEVVSQIIWAKDRFALSRGDYHWQHEPCWYVVRAGAKHNWLGNRPRRRQRTWPWDTKAARGDGAPHPKQHAQG